MSDLKRIIELLPKVVEGRELSLVYDKREFSWYTGYPNKDGNFSVGLYGFDSDIEGSALSLMSQIDEQKKEEM